MHKDTFTVTVHVNALNATKGKVSNSKSIYFCQIQQISQGLLAVHSLSAQKTKQMSAFVQFAGSVYGKQSATDHTTPHNTHNSSESIGMEVVVVWVQ